jgi:Tol biopolymer transport system component/tRNA A-37 threonylcarbamoyl transferase component Bud32
MMPDRWQRLWRLYHDALERDAGERDAFLRDACGDDEGLRREVESLLAQPAARAAFLERRAAEALPNANAHPTRAQAPGARLGPYHLEATLGTGGMGQVFRARDTRLDRIVAIKLVRQELADREDFRRRFEREARAISALNHPHICILHDVGEQDGLPYLVMEYVEGETLAARLRRDRLPIESVLRFGGQIAEALAAAHARGIIHRDLKPANVMITKAAGVKVLDFGLARFTQRGGSSATSAVTTTVSQQIVGTPAYMAPEQLEGQECDARTDIFALGLVIHEMTTGRPVFSGETQAALIAEVMRCAIPPMESVPEKLAHTVERCLARDPEDRWQSAKDVKLELDWTGRSAAVAPVAPVRRTPLRRVWAMVAVVCAGLLLAGTLMFRNPATSELPVRLNLTFDGLIGEGDITPLPSPDGQNFVFLAANASGRRLLWMRPLNAQTARQLPGTEDAEQPFWSPDGMWVGFYAQGKLKKVSTAGGTPQTIADMRGIARGLPNSAAWNGRGDIIWVLANRSPLFHVRESGGTMQPLTRLDPSRAENSHRYPVFLPDGRRFLFVARSGQRENNALYLGSLDSGEPRRLMTVQSNVSYVPPRDGRSAALLHVRDGALVAQAFDGEKVTGEPATVVENVVYTAPSVYGAFAVSSNGEVLILRPATSGRRQFSWFDRKGNVQGALGPPGDYVQPRISFDGTRVLFSRPDEQTGNRDVWYLDTSRATAARLTTHSANDWYPVWSPDGRRIVFASDRGGGSALLPYLKDLLDPGSGETPLFEGPDAINPSDWSRDGQWIAFANDGATLGTSDIWVMSASTGQKPFAYLVTPFAESLPRFSPDSKWIAYVSNESGRYEVYVRPFSGGPAAAGEKILVSGSGADFPVWQRDGKELFFIGGDLKLYSVETADFGRGAAPEPSTLFTPCEATALAGLPMRATPWDFPYDVSPDGQRFLITCNTAGPGRFDVMLNWAGLLK